MHFGGLGKSPKDMSFPYWAGEGAPSGLRSEGKTKAVGLRAVVAWTYPARAPYNEKIQSFGRRDRVPLELKATINLPKTAFPMKANLPQNEPKML